MATDPFTGAFINRLEDRTHAYRFVCELGEVVQFKWFCCDEPYPHSVEKAPVVRLTITPDIQCTGVNNITFNLDNSYVPLGTIASWTIAYGDGATDGPPPAFAPGNLFHGYAAAGTYDVRVTVTDTLGNTGSYTAQVLIVDCALGSVLADYMYALSQTTGPWLRDMTVAVPAWVQHADGLAGNWLNGRDLKVDPHRRHLPIAGRHVWIATQAGIAKSVDNMDHWSQLYSLMPEPRNDDGGAATKAGLDWYCITFNPLVKDTVYILAGTATRSWIYWTTDGGLTWDNWQVSEALPIENDRLMAAWRMEEAAGSRFDCVDANTLYDNNTVTQAAGRIGFAGQFTAVNSEFLNALDSDDLSTGYDESFTLAVWVRADAFAAVPPGAGVNWILSKWNAAEGRSYTLHYISGALNSRFRFEVGGLAADYQVDADNLGNPAINTWYLIVMWHDGVTGAIYIQVNNGAYDVVAAPFAGLDNTADFTVGTTTRFNPAGQQFWDGRIDALHFWERTLTVAERTYLWNAGAGREICAPAPPNWGLTPVGGGLYPQSIDCDADGDALYLALYDGAALPMLVQVDLPLVSTAVGNIRYEPGVGDAINVRCNSVSDNLAISGHFGANEQVETSVDGGVSWTGIDPGTWGAALAQPLVTDPVTLDEVMIVLTPQSIIETLDGGMTWTIYNAAVGYSPGAMVKLVNGNEMIMGDDAANRIDYSPNRGVSTANVTGAFGGNVAALEIT